jgi:pentatricopeptide repeat protein
VEALYEQMLEDGLAPDTIVKNTVLNALVGSGAFRRAEEMFDEMLRSEQTPPNDRTYTMMMHMYSERKDHQKVGCSAFWLFVGVLIC